MHISSRKLGFCVFCLIALMPALPAMAQNRIIKGRIMDDKNQPIAGAAITIRIVDSKKNFYNLKSDKKGEYIQIGLPANSFYVIAHAQGFLPNYATAKPTLSEDTVVNLVLTPGADEKLPIEMTEQELEQAKKEYEQAKKDKEKYDKIRQDSAAVQPLFDAGRRLAEEGKHIEAIEEYKKAIEKSPAQTNIMEFMAESYSKLNQNAEALEIYQKAIAIKPNEASLYTNMGVLLSKMGKNTESQEAFNKAMALNPASAAQAQYNIGVILFNGGHTAEATEAFKKAVAADENYAEAHYQLGMCLSASPDTMSEAIKAFQKYIKIGKKADQIDTAKQMITALEESVKKK
jgi:tetratricopeptide (TPR) repeat protein